MSSKPIPLRIPKAIYSEIEKLRPFHVKRSAFILDLIVKGLGEIEASKQRKETLSNVEILRLFLHEIERLETRIVALKSSNVCQLRKNVNRKSS